MQQQEAAQGQVAQGHVHNTILGPDQQHSRSVTGGLTVEVYGIATTVNTHLGLCDIFRHFHLSDKCNRSAAKCPRGATVQ